ncbi:unnamed protein product, partial [Soboliphyme baturini]|uniref:RING-type domain-containing protein n=1 Tax=Soboliphyme baturini TaxID=241478 RepID=A0A183IK18_9BILA
FQTVRYDENWEAEFHERIKQINISTETKGWLSGSVFAQIIYFLFSDQMYVWAVVNAICCSLFVLVRLVQTFIFGRLNTQEQMNFNSRLGNCMFYKFVFIFGILSVQYLDELLLWSVWFAFIGSLQLLTELASDRFKYITSATGSVSANVAKILALLFTVLLVSIALVLLSIVIGSKLGINTGAFLAAECLTLVFRSVHDIVRYLSHLYHVQSDNVWASRSAFMHYTDFVFELLVLFTDFLHHLHMLVWCNIFLSMASLMICVQLKHLYMEIRKNLRRHQNYMRVVRYINEESWRSFRYPLVSGEELRSRDEICAICWDQLDSARRLPCKHMFHNWCLRSWLEQETSCPTCRFSLAGRRSESRERVQTPGDESTVRFRRNHPVNHFFHFDGRRYARWLPSFSVEVTHNLGRNETFTSPDTSRHITNIAGVKQVSCMLLDNKTEWRGNCGSAVG